MPLLLYCVAPEGVPDTNVGGVRGAAVRGTIEKGLKFFYSEAPGDTPWPKDIVAEARQVHAVVSDIFSRSAVLPFRYPTVVAEEAEIRHLADSRGGRFRDFLARVEGKVQMDIRLSGATDQPAGRPPDDRELIGQLGANAGRAYLEARAGRQALFSAAAEKCRQAAGSADWRIQRQGENIRCQALISRVEVVSFFERMRALELPGGVTAAVSGPWTPAGFWEDDSG